MERQELAGSRFESCLGTFEPGDVIKVDSNAKIIEMINYNLSLKRNSFGQFAHFIDAWYQESHKTKLFNEIHYTLYLPEIERSVTLIALSGWWASTTLPVLEQAKKQAVRERSHDA